MIVSADASQIIVTWTHGQLTRSICLAVNSQAVAFIQMDAHRDSQRASVFQNQMDSSRDGYAAAYTSAIFQHIPSIGPFILRTDRLVPAAGKCLAFAVSINISHIRVFLGDDAGNCHYERCVIIATTIGFCV